MARIHNSNKDAIIGPAYSNPDKYLKLHSSIERKATLLAIGTSRVMQFRDFFFKKPEKFYNAGGGIEKLNQFVYFTSLLSESSQPKAIIVGLDQYFFNAAFDDLKEQHFATQYADNSSPLSYLFENTFTIWNRVINRELLPLAKINKNAVGLNAGVNDNGFAYDGSYYYGEVYHSPRKGHDYQFADTYQRIQNGVKRFQYASEVNPLAIAALDSFLLICKKKNILVFAFLPPYATSVIKTMYAMGDKYGYIKKLDEKLMPVFKKYGYSLSNFTEIEDLGMKDENFIDGFHGSERAYLRILKAMSTVDKRLLEFCDPNYLDSLDKSSLSNLEVVKISYVE